MFAPSTTQNQLFNAVVSFSCRGPSKTRDCFSSSILARKAKNKVKTQLRFWLPSGPALARSTAPTFHDFRTFPKLRQLQGRTENEEKARAKQVADRESQLLGPAPRPAGASQRGLSTVKATCWAAAGDVGRLRVTGSPPFRDEKQRQGQCSHDSCFFFFFSHDSCGSQTFPSISQPS